jgi:hypothetical protein
MVVRTAVDDSAVSRDEFVQREAGTIRRVEELDTDVARAVLRGDAAM